MSNDKKLILNSLEETKKIASEIAHKINLISKNTAKIIFLKGDLGTGKTTLVKEILKVYGLSESVTSPTFTIVEPYLIGNKKIYHMDLYRIESRKELEVLGIEEYSNESNSILFIEWPERGAVSYTHLTLPTNDRV